jgi:hypothetical protein
MHKKTLIASIAVLGLSSSALADGFSASLDAPIFQGNQFGFSVAASLSYSLEVAPRIFVGASLRPSFNASLPTDNVGLSARVGAKYVLGVVKTNDVFFDVPLGIGVNLKFLPGGFEASADLNAGLNVIYVFAPGFKFLAKGDAALGFSFSTATFTYDLLGTLGLFFEPVGNLELFARAEAGLQGSFGGASQPKYNLASGVYYTFVPQFKLGVFVGYNNFFAGGAFFNSGGFTVGLRALFVQNPGTLGIEGAFQP